MEYSGARMTSHREDLRDIPLRGQIDLPFLMLVLLLLTIGVVMIFSASFARAYYDPTDETGGNAA